MFCYSLSHIFFRNDESLEIFCKENLLLFSSVKEMKNPACKFLCVTVVCNFQTLSGQTDTSKCQALSSVCGIALLI